MCWSKKCYYETRCEELNTELAEKKDGLIKEKVANASFCSERLDLYEKMHELKRELTNLKRKYDELNDNLNRVTNEKLDNELKYKEEMIQEKEAHLRLINLYVKKHIHGAD